MNEKRMCMIGLSWSRDIYSCDTKSQLISEGKDKRTQEMIYIFKKVNTFFFSFRKKNTSQFFRKHFWHDINFCWLTWPHTTRNPSNHNQILGWAQWILLQKGRKLKSTELWNLASTIFASICMFFGNIKIENHHLFCCWIMFRGRKQAHLWCSANHYLICQYSLWPN